MQSIKAFIFVCLLVTTATAAQIEIPPAELTHFNVDQRGATLGRFTHLPTIGKHEFNIGLKNPRDESGLFRLTSFDILGQSEPMSICPEARRHTSAAVIVWQACLRSELSTEFDPAAAESVLESVTFVDGQLRGVIDLDPRSFWLLRAIGDTASGPIETTSVWLVPEPGGAVILLVGAVGMLLRTKRF